MTSHQTLDSSKRQEPGALFLPELALGAAAVGDQDRRAIQAFLAAVMAQRGMPLHTTSLWNALYFGWDLDDASYCGVADTVIDGLPSTTMGAQTPALPVGAFAQVATGGGELWVEVVYKQGAHPQVDAGFVPSWISGAPAAPGDGDQPRVAVVRERLVLDPDAFGPGFSATVSQLDRLRRHARWLDEYGHLVIDAVYADQDAELDDASFFARWLFGTHHAALAEGRLRAALSHDASDEDLWDALVASLAVVGELAADAPGVRVWRSYHFFEDSYQGRLADAERPLGASDLEHLVRSLTHIPRGQHVSFAALGPRLVEYAADEQLAGPAYAEAICHASTFILDHLAAQAPDGILLPMTHLRVDDTWQAGGIWRSEQLTSRSTLCDLPPWIALGLGYASSVHAGMTGDAADAAEPGVQRPEPEPELVELTTSLIVFRASLRPLDLNQGRLRVPLPVATGLAATLASRGEDRLGLRLTHEGMTLDAEEAFHWVRLDPDAPALFGVDWPVGFYPGIFVTVSWSVGATILQAHTTLAVSPLELDGLTFDHECDPELLARSLRLTGPQRRATTLRDLIVGVLRRRGRQASDGSRHAARSLVLTSLLGPVAPPAALAAVNRTIDQLVADQIVSIDDGELVWTPQLRRATRVLDAEALRAWQDAGQGRLARLVRRHFVAMFLRRLPAGRRASATKRASYKQTVHEQGMAGQLPTELPDGWTWVEGHERGSLPALDFAGMGDSDEQRSD
ncbi:MAG TPA: hypothetical protein VFG86_23890 [Chloroflexota bacterium]|nr:hypothetical protein [Chloroflexota bacterium]